MIALASVSDLFQAVHEAFNVEVRDVLAATESILAVTSDIDKRKYIIMAFSCSQNDCYDKKVICYLFFFIHFSAIILYILLKYANLIERYSQISKNVSINHVHLYFYSILELCASLIT